MRLSRNRKSIKANEYRGRRSIGRTSQRSIKASTDLSNPYIRIYLTNLGKYNEGELIGEWVDLPISNLDSVLRKIGINEQYEEYFITDSETNIPGLRISEYANLDELNDLAERVRDLDEQQLLIVSAFIDHGESFDEALDKCDDGSVYYDCYTDQDLGYQLIDQTIGSPSELDKDTLEMYFDYDSFGHDERINGDYEDLDNEGYSDQDFGYELVETLGGIESISKDVLEMYFDYDGYGRDSKINGSFTEVEPGTWVELYW